MELAVSETGIQCLSLLLLISLSVLYLPVFYLVVVFLLLVFLFLAGCLFVPRQTLPLMHSLFSVLWAPLSRALDPADLIYTTPNLPGHETNWTLLERGVPPWLRRLTFVTCACAYSEPPEVLILFLGWLLSLFSLLSFMGELFSLEEEMTSDLGLSAYASRSHVLVKIPLRDYGFSTRVAYCSLHSAIFALSLSCFCTKMPALEVLTVYIFALLSDFRLQRYAMSRAAVMFPHAVDGLLDRVILGVLISVDFILCGRLFWWAINDTDSLFLISVSYCNAFAALMEFRLRVWTRLLNEQALLQGMPRASRQDLLANNDVCAICLSTMTSARITICKHIFHGKCLRLSLRNNVQCPMCKCKLLSTPGFGHVIG